MHYSKIIKLASYFKSSGNKEVYLDLIKLAIASEGRFEALVMGSYPSGERKEDGQYDHTIITEAKRKRDKVVELINNEEEKNANIPALVNIINRVNEFKSQDTFSIWREGLDPKHFEKLKSLLSTPAPRQAPPRESYQDTYRAPPREAQPFYWLGMSSDQILAKLGPIIDHHRYIVDNVSKILDTPFSWIIRDEPNFIVRMFSKPTESFYSGKIINYFPGEKILRVRTGQGSYNHVKLSDPKVILGQGNENIASLEVLKNEKEFPVIIPVSASFEVKGYIVGAYAYRDGSLEIVTQSPPDPGDLRGNQMIVNRFYSRDRSVEKFFRLNHQLFTNKS